MLNIQILIDNSLHCEGLIPEDGFAAFIVADGKKILFDTGEDGNVVGNAKKLGIDLLSLDYIALSHGHHDHINGLAALVKLYQEAGIKKEKRPKLLAHPDCFIIRYKGEKNDIFIGSNLPLEAIQKEFDCVFTKKPYALSKNLTFLGEIPRTNDFEGKIPIGVAEHEGQMKADFIYDDSALIYTSEDGLVIISGCSHAGICNIVDYAKTVGEDERIVQVIGGLHLKSSDGDFICKVLEELKARKVKKLCACHCTGSQAIEILHNDKDLEQIDIGCGYRFL